MKLVTCEHDGRRIVGLVLPDARLLDVERATDGELSAPIEDLLGNPAAVQRLRKLGEAAGQGTGLDSGAIHAPNEVRWLAPVPRPGKILCLGRNYPAHAAESGWDVPEWPCIFSKPASAVIGHGQAIRIPSVSDQVDYEVELAVVIGRTARHVSKEQAYDYVGGYTVLNDVSVRDYQKEKGGGQWTLGKSFDTACPMGPWLVTTDDIPDPHDLGIRCEVTGEKMQLARTDQMFFKIPYIIEHLSACLTLEPGDVIATGTPAGVGMARTPPRWLKAGDVVECTVEGIGTLRNPVE
jgi:2-keto-4-pentenoate hydratase/2-oxohepta-3-ene-1,7-dioic acid hydratase in catechol pathway